MSDIMDEMMDEKTADILANVQTRIEALSKDINYLTKSVDEIKSCYVTKIEFFPVKAIVFTLISIVSVTFIGAILAMVLDK